MNTETSIGYEFVYISIVDFDSSYTPRTNTCPVSIHHFVRGMYSVEIERRALLVISQGEP